MERCNRESGGLTADHPAGREDRHEIGMFLIGCMPVVCRISGSGIRKAVPRSVWIVNDKRDYHALRENKRQSGAYVADGLEQSYEHRPTA